MSSRSREKGPITASVVYKPTAGAPQTWFTADSYTEVFWESSFPGPCNCYHTRATPYTGTLTSSQGTLTFTNCLGPLPAIPFPTKLNWGKLPTSSEFGIIQFFAELDDTIALFGKRFWSQLTYGSFTWGVLPFVSDVVSLLETIKGLSSNLSNFDYEDTFRETFPATLQDGGQTWKGVLDCTYHYSGKADMSFQEGAAIWLDRLGFHPDLSTAWDLLPLSFVVDWLLPVGDFLESLRGGGWVKVVNFNGWQSCKFTWSCSYTTAGYAGSLPYKVEGYKRSRCSTILTVPLEPDLPTLELPSFRELFNMVYLAGLGRRLGL